MLTAWTAFLYRVRFAPSPSPTPSPTSTGKGKCHIVCLPKGPLPTPGDVLSSAVDDFARKVQEGELAMIKFVTSWWTTVRTGIPGVQDSGGIDPNSAIGFVSTHTAWIASAAAVFGLLVAAGRTAWERRGEPARQAFSGLLTLIVVTGVGALTVRYLVDAGDIYSNWIIGESLHSHSFNDQLSALSSLEKSGLNSALIIIIGIFAIISMLIQIVMLIGRLAMITLLTGLLPVAAAVSGMPDGKMWWRKTLAWLIAFVLYKPVAATIYAFAFFNMKKFYDPSGATGTDELIGIVTIVIAVLALPALMRFVTPMVAPTTSGSGGAAGMALVGAAVASGARMLPGRGSGGAGGGAASGPSADGAREAGGKVPVSDGQGQLGTPSPQQSAEVSGAKTTGQVGQTDSGGSEPATGSTGGGARGFVQATERGGDAVRGAASRVEQGHGDDGGPDGSR